MGYTAPELVLIIGSIGTTIVSIVTAIMVQRVHKVTNSNYSDLKRDNQVLQEKLDTAVRGAAIAEEVRRVLAAEAAKTAHPPTIIP